jgi:hypothetical protein
MAEKREPVPTGEAGSADVDRILQVLTMEYEALNARMVARISARFQFLGFLTAGAAILAAGTGHSLFFRGTWILAIGVFMLGLISFWGMGRTITALSSHLAEVENGINKLIITGPNASKLLHWHLDKLGRGGLLAFLLGSGYFHGQSF